MREGVEYKSGGERYAWKGTGEEELKGNVRLVDGTKDKEQGDWGGGRWLDECICTKLGRGQRKESGYRGIAQNWRILCSYL